jgi:hypothetical protein
VKKGEKRSRDDSGWMEKMDWNASLFLPRMMGLLENRLQRIVTNNWRPLRRYIKKWI